MNQHFETPQATEPGLLLYIRVDSVAATADEVLANGGKIVRADRRGRTRDHREVPRLRETSFGLYQEPGGAGGSGIDV